MDNKHYPFQGHYFSHRGFRYHYLDEGRGEPVLMLHGNPSWSIYYRHLVEALRSNYRTIVPDHLGCGLSDKPTSDQYSYTLADRVADVDALLEHLHIDEKVTLIAHDWGGAIAMTWALANRDKIKRIILFNTAAFLPQKNGKLKLPWQLHLVRNPLGKLLVKGGNAFCRGTAWIGCQRQRMDKSLRDAYCAPYNSWRNRVAVQRFVEDIPASRKAPAYPILQQLTDKLGELGNIPSMICWGDKDPVFRPKFLKQWREYFPNVEIHRFADCGHYILEDACEDILPLVDKFMEKTA